MKSLVYIITLLSFLLAGCAATKSPQSIETDNLNNLQNLSINTLAPKQKMVSKLRFQALEETAMTIGAQGGLARRASQINAMLTLNRKELTQIFNFTGLMLDNNILPPVLEESKQSLKIDSTDTIRITDRIYRLYHQARFVTTPPTWRDYLVLSYSKPDLPDKTLLPRGPEEQQIWKKYISIGWQNGINQANNIFAYGLASLQRDYKGMMLYRKLLAQNMVSKPFVAKSNMGITSNADNSEIRINDKILRITAKPKLYSNSKLWKPILVQP